MLLLCPALAAQDLEWPGFRGPGRDGLATSASPPTKWSATENMKWQLDLPGPGSSSPIIVGDRIYLTCFSGYGEKQDRSGESTSLKHHVVCIDRKKGEILWDREIPSAIEGEPSMMQLKEHGFASPTPVTDGKTLYVYFGKTGALALDLDGGEILWHVKLGKFEYEEGEDPLGEARPRQPDGTPVSMRWGAGSSPLLCDDLVVINAATDSDSVRAIDRKTGNLVWKRSSPRFEGSSVSPQVVGKGDDRLIVMTLAGEVWGLEIEDGALRWKIETKTSTGMVPTPVADDDVVYTFGGEGDAFAIRFGKDVKDDDRVAWKGKNVGIPSPVLVDGEIFLVDSRGMGSLLDATTGETKTHKRLPGRTGGVYASPAIAGDKLYVVSRKRGTFVYSTDGEFELLAQNRIEGDDTDFHGSPAFAGDEIFLRSNRRLYCFGEDG